MKKKTVTKHALLASVLAMVLCVTMLVGTTFAWFTDTASANVNQIKSGKLDVGLYMKDGDNWVTAEGKTLQFKTADNRTDNILWEPGCTYNLPELQIRNDGNLALKYKIVVSGIEGDTGLASVIDWTITNTGNTVTGTGTTNEYFLLPEEKTDTLTISGHMQETAGNDYMNKSIDGIAITVVATQQTAEFDSENNTYDGGATYPKTVSDATSIADAVADLAKPGNKNVVVTVTKSMDKTSGIKTDAGNTFTLDMNGNTVGVSYGQGSANTTTNGMQLLQGSTVTLKNGTYKANHGDNADHNIAILIQNYSNLTIDGCTLDMTEANDPSGNSKGTSYVISSNCGNITIKGKTNITARSGDYALDVMHWENTAYEEEGTRVVFDETMTGTVDGKIDVYCYRNNKVVKPVDDGGATLVIKGGTFKNSGLTLEQFKAFVPAGYTVTTNADGSFTVSK